MQRGVYQSFRVICGTAILILLPSLTRTVDPVGIAIAVLLVVLFASAEGYAAGTRYFAEPFKFGSMAAAYWGSSKIFSIIIGACIAVWIVLIIAR